jgi:molybdate transport system substrate-binding protein
MHELLSARTVVRALLVAGAAIASFPHAVQSAEIKVIAANALKDGYTELVSAFEKSSGHAVVTTWTGTVNATKRVSDGEVYDLVIIGSRSIDQLIAAGKLAAGSRADFARSGVGVAIRTGLPKPDIATADAVKAAVLAAGSVAWSAGPSGAYVGELMKKMGIGDQVATKLKQPSSGAEVAALVARGEVDLAFAQVSEFLDTPGLVNLGPLPAGIQNFTIYAIGVHASAPSAEAAAALVKHLRASEAAPAIRKMGMEPGSRE